MRRIEEFAVAERVRDGRQAARKDIRTYKVTQFHKENQIKKKVSVHVSKTREFNHRSGYLSIFYKHVNSGRAI